MGAGGYADSRAQGNFCGSPGCVIFRIYDQSKHKNHLDIAPPGGYAPKEDRPVNATRGPLMAGGHKVYSAYFEGGMGCRARTDKTSGVAAGGSPESVHMVASGTHYNNGCW